MAELPRRADIVVVGAGIVGCSIAAELSRVGITDVVVCDQGPLPVTGGSTSHAPGLVFQTNPSKTMCELAQRSVARYTELGAFLDVGGIEVAASPKRHQELKRRHGLATSWGLESELLTPEQVAERIPLLDPSRIHAGYHVPSDGVARGVDACAALARESRARFVGETAVTGIDVAGGRVRAVETSAGRIETDLIVVAAGIWGPLVGRMAGIQVPLYPVEHQLVWTTPVVELAGEEDDVVRHPILRHQDSCMYFRQRGERYGVGSYQHRPLLVDPDEIPSHADAPVMPTMLTFTPEDFEPAWRDTVALLPPLGQSEPAEAMNAMFSFTPDGNPLLGETEVAGLWLAEAVWVTHGPGVGWAVAEWIATGSPPLDLRECDVNRFEAHVSTPAYVRARAATAYDEVYDIIHPLQPMEEPRPIRVSPFYARQQELDAVFLEANGWERPHWYEANASLVEGEPEGRDPWASRYWSPIVAAEALATRERGGLFDMTSLKRAEVTGPGALGFLQRLTTNELDRQPGYVTYALMLDERGGILSDVTVARLGETRFQLGLNGPRDVAYLRRQAPPDVHVADTTGGTCCIGLWGPLARDVLQPLTHDDVSHEGFGFFRARELFVREVPVTTLRLSYVGELGWELYAPAEFGRRLWDTLWEPAQEHGLVAAGRGAFNAMRLEKGYRSWGTDMWSEHDPYEAGLGFAVRPDKGDFVGREALGGRGEPSRRLVPLTLDRVVMGKEPVWANGEPVGFTTSADWAHSLGTGIAYAWLPAELAGEGQAVEVEYFHERYPASVAPDPPFDPEMKRMRR